VYSLIPNTKELEQHLSEFCEICDADEIVLFERATFLVISHATRPEREHRDVHRFEKISNIIKQFKLSCRFGACTCPRRAPRSIRPNSFLASVRSKTQAHFQAMEVRNSNFTAFIDYFTNNTYVMVIMSDPSIRKCRACCASRDRCTHDAVVSQKPRLPN
jgi:Ras-related GTP-binding protein A/B